MRIKIDTKCLTVDMYTVTRYNGSGLFYLSNDEEERALTSSEVRKLGGDVVKIIDTLELMSYADGKYFTDDGLNFIGDYEYSHLSDEDKEDFEVAEFEIV